MNSESTTMFMVSRSRNRFQCFISAIGHAPIFALAFLGAALLCAAQQPARPSSPQPFLVSRISTLGQAPCIMVEIGGIALSFAVDTGSNMTAIDSVHRNLLGKRIRREVVTLGDTEGTVDIYPSLPLTLKGSEGGESKVIPEAGIACIDLAEVREDSGLPIEGIVGMDVLRHFVLDINYDKGMLVLSMPSAQQWIGKGERIPIRFVNERPMIHVHVGQSAALEALLDTASTSSIEIGRNAFNDLAHSGRLNTGRTIRYRSQGQLVEKSLGRLAALRVGRFVHNDVVLRTGSVALLGSAYLSRYSITFDFPNDCMYLRPGETFESFDHSDAFGMELQRRDGRFIVRVVSLGSIADSVGVKVGDIVKSVDGVDVERLGRYGLSRRLEFGPLSTMIFVRDNHEVSARFPKSTQSIGTRNSMP